MWTALSMVQCSVIFAVLFSRIRTCSGHFVLGVWASGILANHCPHTACTMDTSHATAPVSPLGEHSRVLVHHPSGGAVFTRLLLVFPVFAQAARRQSRRPGATARSRPGFPTLVAPP